LAVGGVWRRRNLCYLAVAGWRLCNVSALAAATAGWPLAGVAALWRRNGVACSVGGWRNLSSGGYLGASAVVAYPAA
jgi:hypothetical protein